MTDTLNTLRDLIARHRFDAVLRHACTWQGDDPAMSLMRQGAQALKRQDAFGAVAAFRSLADLDADFPALPDCLAAAYRRDARYQDCLNVAGTSRQIRFEHGHSHLALGQGEQAMACFDAILADDPDHAASWVGSHAAALDLLGLDAAQDRLHRAVGCLGANGRYWSLIAAYDLLCGRDTHMAAHITPYPARHALVDGILALLPHGAAQARLFGLSANVLRFAMAQADLEGMILEFGVRRGTSTNVLAGETTQLVHGFDSFQGLPTDWIDRPAGILTTGLDLPPVRPNVRLYPGWFHHTLPPFLQQMAGPVRLVNVDSDVFDSAHLVLTALTPHLCPGSVVIFDEFIGNRTWAQDEFLAFQHFIAATGLGWRVLALAPATKQVVIRIENA